MQSSLDVNSAPGMGLSVGTFFILTMSWYVLKTQFNKNGYEGEIAATVAKHVLSGLGCFCFAITGSVQWANPPPGLSDTMQTRLYGYAGDGQQALIWAMLGYQLWDLSCCVIVPSLCKLESIGHHSVTAYLAYLCTYPYLHYYAIFFIGFAEISTVPLAVMDVFKTLPDLAARYPQAALCTRVVFAACFLSVRVLYWPTICYQFWKDNLVLLETEKQHSTSAVIIFFVANIFLTLMQFYWGYLVVQGILKKLGIKTMRSKSGKTLSKPQ